MFRGSYLLLVAVLYVLGSSVPAMARLYINEFLTSNGSVNMDPDFSIFTDWIEIYNDTAVAVDLGSYYLSDDLNEPDKWSIPASTIVPGNGFIIFWADGRDSALHTSFGLSADGETIILSGPQKNVIDSLTYSPQMPNRSCGRNSDQTSHWGYFENPSPGLPNTTKSLSASAQSLPPPVFSTQGGFYNQSVTLKLSSKNPSTVIRFTTDGADPDLNSRVYSEPLVINETTVVRAKAFSDVLYNSTTSTHTFITNASHQLPVIALATNPAYLWDDVYGIYTEGSNGAVGFLGDVANYYQNWERPINVELFDVNQQLGFNEQAGVKIVGLVSRQANLKGMSIFFKSKYGTSEIDYPLFASRKNTRLKEFVLRNSGAYDLLFTHLRDGMMNNLVANQMDVDYQAYQPAVIYLNGNYWGILNIREKLNNDYPYLNYNVDPDNIDLLESFLEMHLVDGDLDSYNELIQYVSEHDLKNDELFKYVESKIDVKEYINYHITQLYFLNTDWPGNNVKMWRPKTERGKWRWILSDVEIGFNLLETTSPDQDAIARILFPGATDPLSEPWSTLLFRNLMKNTRFKQEFIQTFALYLSTVFDSTRVTQQIDSTQNLLQSEFPAHIAKWNHIPSMEVWEQNVEVLREFARLRPQYCLKHLKNKFLLQQPTPVTFIVQQKKQGRIEVNHRVLPSDTCTLTLFKYLPFTLKAIPNPGYQFIGWSGTISSAQDSIQCYLQGESEIIAKFSSNHHIILPNHINETMHLTSDKSPYYVNQDVTVDSNATLSVDPGVTIYLADSVSVFVYGSLEINGEEAHPVMIRPDSVSNASAWGALCFLNATAPSHLRYVHLERATRCKSDPNTYFASITAKNTDLNLDHVYLESYNQPFYVENGTTIIKSSSLRSRATCDLINVKYGNATVEGCDLKGNYAFDTDAIDFDGIEGGVIKGNKIYDFLGSNSDGIDLGEESKNIVIQDNVIYNCSDKGISVGQASTATIDHNTILFCNMGVGVKDKGSSVYLDRNTFHGNQTGVACFEKNAGAGGGQAVGVNCIFSYSNVASLSCDGVSTLAVSYSMSTSDFMSGVHNFIGSPRFYSPHTGDFNLLANSPCINAGDPESTPDPDYSVADLGAHYFAQQISINELNYFSEGKLNPGYWVELANSGKDTVDLRGWTLSSPANKWQVVLMEEQKIPPMGFSVISGDRNKFSSKFKYIQQVVTDRSFELGQSDETLLLKNRGGSVIDSVSYTCSRPWPHLLPAQAQTLALKNIDFNNAQPENWSASSSHGTPGKPNVFTTIPNNVVVNEINYNSHPYYNTGDWIELYNNSEHTQNISGWMLTDGNKNHGYIFPVSTAIYPGGYLVICRKQETFNLFYPETWNCIGDFEFGLGSDGEEIRLFDENDNLVDSLVYGVAAPWPVEPNGAGPSLELINPGVENTIPGVWSASVGYGTPGILNSRYKTVTDTPFVPPTVWSHTALFQNYPNPCTHQTVLSYVICSDDIGLVHLALYNVKGQLVKTLVHKKQNDGFYRVIVTSDNLASGTYVCRLTTKTNVRLNKLLVVK